MYSHLFQPLQVGAFMLPNRIIMGSMHTNLEEIPGGFERAAVYYAERARGKVGLIITGGIAPCPEGCVSARSAMLTNAKEVAQHRLVTEAVHREGGRICMQILHTGRYGYHPAIVAPSAIQAPINVFSPREMTEEDILSTIRSFGQCASLAREAGYDGVEIMGSEGYLIHQFLTTRTNQRKDSWGGEYPNRMQFALRIVEEIKQMCGSDFLLIFRLSLLDLVENGSSWEEIVQLARALEKGGVHIINSGIGWHEARIPTIATPVPRRFFSSVTGRLKKEVTIPVIAVNRINTPEIAEAILAEGQADLVSMARPLLADPEFALKAMDHRANEINTCIACNQACLDHTFQLKISSCMVNPRACHETELQYLPVQKTKNIAVVGGGPAGMAFAHIAALRGHKVTLFEASDQLGGQFHLAKVIPGKEEYAETIRYYTEMLSKYEVNVHCNTTANAAMFSNHQFEEVVIASGIRPRIPEIPGIGHPMVYRYDQLLSGSVDVGDSVAILGAGGIGFDVAAFLAHDKEEPSFDDFWGIDMQYSNNGGLRPRRISSSQRKIYLLQRKGGKPGSSLGKTTGWIHKSTLTSKGVTMMSGVTYDRIDDDGLHITVNQKSQCLKVSSVIICAGQMANRTLADELETAGLRVHTIGGSADAEGLDAKVAIDQACRLAARL